MVVTHELASIFTIADDAVFLDAETRTMIARGNPKALLDTCPEPCGPSSGASRCSAGRQGRHDGDGEARESDGDRGVRGRGGAWRWRGW